MRQAMRIIVTVSTRIVSTILLLAVVGAIALLVGVGIGPHTGRYQLYTVLSDSMGDAAPAGSLVLATRVRTDALVVGDVITYQAPVGDHSVVTHRVVDIISRNGDIAIRTKGDANSAADPWTAVLDGDAWRMRAAVPHLGRLLAVFRSDLLHVLTVFVAPAALAGMWLTSIWRRPISPVVPRTRHVLET